MDWTSSGETFGPGETDGRFWGPRRRPGARRRAAGLRVDHGHAGREQPAARAGGHRRARGGAVAGRAGDVVGAVTVLTSTGGAKIVSC